MEEIKPDDTGVEHLDAYKLQRDLNENIEIMKKIFVDDDTLITREFENQRNNKVRCCAFFVDGMVNNKIINEKLKEISYVQDIHVKKIN